MAGGVPARNTCFPAVIPVEPSTGEDTVCGVMRTHRRSGGTTVEADPQRQ